MALAVTKHQSTWFDAQGFYCGGYHTCQLVKLVAVGAFARTARRRVVCKDVLLYQAHDIPPLLHQRPIVLLDQLKLKLIAAPSHRSGRTVRQLPTDFRRGPLLVITMTLAAACGPHPLFRRHVSRFVAEPATSHRGQPPRAPPAPHRPARVSAAYPATLARGSAAAHSCGRPGRWASPFLCPAARNTDPTDCGVELKPR